MAGTLVGGAILSASLQVLFDRMASRSVVDFIRGQRLSDSLLKKLKISLLAVNAVLNDAEEKQITNQAVKSWLDELKDATYDAEDLLDEISTKALSCKLEAESQYSTDQVQNSISPSFNLFDEGIKSKIEEILDRLEYIAKQKDVLGLKEVAGGKPYQRFPSSSLVEESGVYGRDDDREKIIKSLLSDDASGNDMSVIAIVGMGGVGKTTLAQLVYNDQKVKDHFDLKAWVCVSEEFDFSRVTKTILEAVTSSACDFKDFSLLQVKLKETLTGKRVLLILDDVWNEKYNDWDVLRSPFRSAATGSKIIVTTRNENVASTMCTVPPHHLKQLLDEDCWSLFAKHAFYNANSAVHSNLEAIAREIVKKCKGLPLAAKTLGGLLRSKQGAEEWSKILKSNIWDFSNDRSDILPALRLSYHYLPPHLKRCFAYCSIFPKDYEFEKEQLILWWMAEDFLQHPDRTKSPEEVGEENFHDLVSRSFFQRSGGDNSFFIMHDLFNDLAKFVSGDFCFRLEGDYSHEIPEKTRHLSYCRTIYDASKKFEAFYDAKRLRTFLPLNSSTWNHMYNLTNKVLDDLLPSVRLLRVLSLSHYKNIGELPDSIGKLKHLRYLDVSYTTIIRLPDSTCTLYNLQTLMLSGCYCLSELPTNLGRLINLRHLDISGTILMEMPKQMSRLRSLQTLSTFVVGTCDGFMISELKEFRHLRGALHIINLQNVVHARDALEVRMKDKEYLDELVLEWSELGTADSQNERDVLDRLQPHTNLKKLTIKYYGGTRFPHWLVDHSFSNMVYLCLSNCKYCSTLPPLGLLWCLKELSVIGFDRVERVGPEFYGNGSSANMPFRSLEILRFKQMLELVDWFFSGDGSGDFPCLRELYIEECPKLTGGLPNHLPSLEKLVVSECRQLVASLPRAPAIRSLELIYCDEVLLERSDELSSQLTSRVPEISNVANQPDSQMTTLPNQVGLQRFSCLEILNIRDMSELKELPPGLHLLPIECLEIHNCPSLESFPRGSLPTTLKTLHISGCWKLELFLSEGEDMAHNGYASLESFSLNGNIDSLKSFPLGLFPKLNHLCIVYCKNLESIRIPEGHLTSLTTLQIRWCPKLVSFPKGGLPAPNLTSFKVHYCKNLQSLPERMHTLLSSLHDLHIQGCTKLESFPEGGLPSNLRTIWVSECKKLMEHRMEWHLQRLASLKYCYIEECEELESFPEEWLLPSTLTSLSISSLRNLKYLDKGGLQHLISLQQLYIKNCQLLQCLPEEGLPSSISLLHILGSPLLKQRCQRENGEDWPKIARIPRIVIDYKLIS